MITVDLGDGVIRQVPASELDGPFVRISQDDAKQTTFVLVYLKGVQVVHRSVHIQLKQGLTSTAIPGQMGS